MDSGIDSPVMSRIIDLKKRLIKQGKGWYTPEIGDEVQVHYRDPDEESHNDSSLRNGKLFKFILGHDSLRRTWDECIKTMSKGEIAVFTFPPVHGRESGSPPTVAPNRSNQSEFELLCWFSAKDICKDGGIFKNIVQKGNGLEHPKDLDQVLVKFKAWLDYDTSVGGTSDGVEFTVNEGHFCPALSKAVKTMRKGEIVFLIVKPQYGFRSEGKPASSDHNAVPPDATLHVALELVSWKTVLTNDKKIIKKIMKEGEGYDQPNDGAIVKVKLLGKLEDNTEFVMKGYDGGDELYEFKIGEGEVIEGLHIAAVTMKKAEIALLTIEPEYAFGSSGSKQELAEVPANSTVYYDIEMVSFVKEKEFQDMNPKEKIAAATEKNEVGDFLYKADKFEKASKKYQMAAMYIENDYAFSDEEKQKSKDLKILCYLNDASCKIGLKEYYQAITICDEVLELDINNKEATCMKSIACLMERPLLEESISEN